MRTCLSRCVESILHQTYPHFELLLIDDGSTDGSERMADQWAQKDRRIRVVHQRNMGLSGARNTALAHARGEYVTFVDADDAILPAYIETLLGLCRRFCLPLSACNHRIIRGAQSGAACFPQGEAPRVLTSREALENVLFHRVPDVSCWGKLYARTLLDGIVYPQGKLYEDTYTFAEVMLRAGAIAYTSVPLYDYVIRRDSISQGTYSEERREYIDAVEHMTRRIAEAYPELQKDCLCRNVFALLSVRRYFVDCEPRLRGQRDALEKRVRGSALPVLKNKRVPKRDKAAVIALLLGPKVYDILWKAYDARRWKGQRNGGEGVPQ